jgi:hypothetical protein
VSHTCPRWLGYFLLAPMRRILPPPARILRPFVRPGQGRPGARLRHGDVRHVSRAAFESSVGIAERGGVVVRDRPRIGSSRTALLGRRAAPV